MPGKRKIWIIVLSLMTMLSSCSLTSLREAQCVVAQADSLWHEGKQYGVDEGDSATLAQAYERLKPRAQFTIYNSQFTNSYAHACYHYGRLLREKDNPVEAMQVFINAIHSGTKDYHILGRVYSNMGSICHLAGAFPLSYDMFEKSAGCFLADNDSLSYYFLLNDMAFEKAMLADKEACLACLHTIEQNCSDRDVILKTMETKAELCLKHKQYDSAIICSNYLIEAGFDNASVMLIKAQAYDDLSLPDSALLYAKMIMERSCVSPQERFNAIFIILHNDSTLDGDSINALASQREDIRYYDYEPRRNLCMQAVQLLEKDLTRKPDWRWLYAVIATVLIIGSCILLYVHKRRSQHKLLSQQVDDLSKINDSVQEQHEHIKKEYTEYKDNLLTQIEQNYAILTQSPNLFQDIHWKDFNALSQIINDNFGMLAAKLQGIYHLSEKEIRLCILVLLDITNSKQMAQMLYYSENGIRNFKNRTAKKIGTNSVKMRNSLLKLAISEYPKESSNKIVHAQKI